MPAGERPRYTESEVQSTGEVEREAAAERDRGLLREIIEELQAEEEE